MPVMALRCLLSRRIVAAWAGMAVLNVCAELWLAGAESIRALAAICESVMVFASWWLMTPVIAITALRFRMTRNSVASSVAVHTATFAVALLVIFVARSSAFWLTGSSLAWTATALLWGVDQSIVTYVAIVAFARAVGHHNRLHRSEIALATAERDTAITRSRALEAQLHPHFLFNALNSIASLLYDRPAEAKRMITRLRDLLTIVLESDDRVEVTLREELLVVETYVAVQQARYPNELDLRVHVGEEAGAQLVPRLLLQPIVENAIRHGLDAVSGNGVIEISANVSGAELAIEISDNGVGLPSTAASPAGGGIGLANVRERIAVLYGPQSSVAVRRAPLGGCSVMLFLPAHSEPGTDTQAFRRRSMTSEKSACDESHFRSKHSDANTSIRSAHTMVRHAARALATYGLVAAFFLALTLIYVGLGALPRPSSVLAAMAFIQSGIILGLAVAAGLVSARFPLTASNRAIVIGANLVIPPLMIGIHMALDSAVRQIAALPSLHVASAVLFDTIVCLCALAIAQRIQFDRRARLAERLIAEQEASHATSTFALSNSHLSGELMARWLHHLEKMVDRPDQAETLILELATFLRIVLRRADKNRDMFEQERALVESFDRVIAASSSSNRLRELDAVEADLRHRLAPSCSSTRDFFGVYETVERALAS